MKFLNDYAQFCDFDPLSGGGFSSGEKEFGSAIDGGGLEMAGGFGDAGGFASAAEDFGMPPSPMGADGSKARGPAMSTSEEAPF